MLSGVGTRHAHVILNWPTSAPTGPPDGAARHRLERRGRLSVHGFWWFPPANFLVYLVLLVLSGISGISFILYLIYPLAMLVPSLAAAVRRLHDTNKSGWMILLGLNPLVGVIILLVFYVQAGTPGPNDHGSESTA